MYRRILAAYDGSEEGRVALREAVVLGRRCGAELHLLAVIGTESGAEVEGRIYANVLGQHSESHEAVLQEAVELLAARGIGVNALLVHGDPAIEIPAHARKIGADLVVVGYRRQNIVQRWWSGPKGAFLSDHLDCSLLIARNEIGRDDFLKMIQS
jgi:nucleotide-binding universal stress UspA family protein